MTSCLGIYVLDPVDTWGFNIGLAKLFSLVLTYFQCEILVTHSTLFHRESFVLKVLAIFMISNCFFLYGGRQIEMWHHWHATFRQCVVKLLDEACRKAHMVGYKREELIMIALLTFYCGKRAVFFNRLRNRFKKYQNVSYESCHSQ